MRLATALALFLALSGAADAATLKVALDRSTRISLARPARDIVVTNPKVADVTLIDARNIVVLGKGYGTTSLLVVDAAGRTIADHQIVVSSPDTGAVSFYRGSKVQSFACEARCEPTSEPPTSDVAPAPASSTP
jgi:Flp pilus assembly secretin CpaC